MSSEPLWKPQLDGQQANLKQYESWLEQHYQLSFADYDALWSWSIQNIDLFWKTILEYFDVQYDGHFNQVTSGHEMPGVKWFEGIHLSYAEHIFRGRSPKDVAIISRSETGPLREMTWGELQEATSTVQQFLKSCGIGKGDRVVGYLPCVPETTVAFLAANSLGAVWSCCSPDFGTQSVLDRFAQIEPKVFIAVDQYSYGGKQFSKKSVIEAVIKAIPSIERVILIAEDTPDDGRYISWSQILKRTPAPMTFDRVPFDHPIWILYSSGTTGLPKAITHSHGGILLEHLKYMTFHNDVHPGEKCFWYTTTGWMMWNYIHGSLLCGATMILYDGSPAFPDMEVLWNLAQDTKMNHFGTSAGFILANMKAGVRPSKYQLGDLRSIGSTGSTLPPEGFEWVYAEVKDTVWLTSMSGGTDVCSAFVGGNPTLPVYDGEIQCRALGCSLFAFDEEGHPLQGEVGEMVITQPMPSMPVFFWNDPQFERYKESYFEVYPGIWRHGDWIEITVHQGVIIYGRSDATLNRGGVRIGTSEIYRAVDHVESVKDSLILCVERGKGEFYMPLFVQLQPGIHLTDSLKKEINQRIREAYSPRHVPDEIVQVDDIPYTISGKKTETPIKKIFMGRDPEKVVNQGALRNPNSIQFYIDFYNHNLRDKNT